jgi:hypothetical protein
MTPVLQFRERLDSRVHWSVGWAFGDEVEGTVAPAHRFRFVKSRDECRWIACQLCDARVFKGTDDDTE